MKNKVIKALLTIVMAISILPCMSKTTYADVTVRELKPDANWENREEFVTTAHLGGFVKTTADQAKAWTGGPTEGYCSLIYDVTGDTFQIAYFINGKFDRVTSMDLLKDFVWIQCSIGHKFYYTTVAAYSVTLTGGQNATKSGGSTFQIVTAGQAMTEVTYTADTGFYFNDFTPIQSNGVTASKTSRTTITVSGTPTGDVSIEIPNATDGLTPITDNVMVTFDANGGTPGELWPEEPESFPVGPFDLSIFWSVIDDGSMVSAPSGYHCAGITFTDSEGASRSYDYGSTESHSLSKDSTLTFNWEEEDRYYCSSGDSQSYQIGSSKELLFVFKRTVDDESAYTSFQGIRVNGAGVPEKTGNRVNYVTESGSVKIKLQPGYLDTLSEGNYTLTADFDDDMTADANFTITKNNSGGGGSSSNTGFKIPRTGIE